MPTVSIRDVPQDVRDELASRAARAGQSLQEYVRELLVHAASRPSINTWLAQVQKRRETAGVTVHTGDILCAKDADRK